MDTPSVPVPSEQQIQDAVAVQVASANTLTAAVERFVCTTAAEYEHGARFLDTIKLHLRELDADEENLKRGLLDTLNRIRDKYRGPREILRAAITTLNNRLTTWRQAQEWARAQEEARLRQEAAKAQAKLEEKAAKLEAKGKGVEAAIVRETAPILAAPAAVPSAVPKINGMTTRTSWKFRITNAALIPREYLMVDEKKVGGVVRATKGTVQIPGIEAYPEETLARTGGTA